MDFPYKLGKKAARPNAVKFKFNEFFDLTELPKPPQMFGLGKDYDWGMLANDQYGDCVWAGQAHLEKLWYQEFQRQITFTDDNVLSDYAALTGFDPNKPDTDGGTDMVDAAEYWRSTGIVDEQGTRHKIDAYVSIPKYRFDEIAVAAWLFDGIGLGVEFPRNAMYQFEKRVPWTVVPGDKIEGGHYIPLIGRNSRGNYWGVTWGRIQAMTPEWIATYADEVVAYLSLDILDTKGLSKRGFNLPKLKEYLADL